MALLSNLLARASKRVFDTGTPKRSPLWHAVEKEHLEAHPACAACGSIKNLQVHHKMPFHIDSSLELDRDNLITLCMSPGNECHLYVGHGDSWRCYNPTVERDSAELLKDPEKKKALIQEIRAHRLNG